MTQLSARLSLIFSSLGHFYFHMFTAFYAVIVLRLEVEWGVGYNELLELWWLGSLLVGLAALPAGRLGDVWSVPGMMVIYFIGMGAAAILCGLVSAPPPLMIGLAGIGLFGAIYHPIGIPWMIRNAAGNPGKMLAVNGIFGSLGSAGAGLIAGILIDVSGWRAAFMVPGVVATATGLAMLWFMWRGDIRELSRAGTEKIPAGHAGTARIFIILLIAMFTGGLIYHGTQNALPKLFEIRVIDIFIPWVTGNLGQWAGGLLGGASGIGLLVAAVYTVGGLTQLVGGMLADRYPLKHIYVSAWLIEMALLAVLARAGGLGLIGIAMLAVMMNLAQLPAENMLLARFTPERHHGLAFGIKFVLAFGAAPVAIMLLSKVWAATGEFEYLFLGFGAGALLITVLATMLPHTESARPVPAPGE
ncbi:MAG: MFS transporter [Alphaproteobacteria bacterium]|nr:MFS transporter [Alphaproteobacteria bacterium]